MKLPLTTIGLVIFVVALQIQVMRLEGRLDNYMHPPATVSAADYQSCMAYGCVKHEPLSANTALYLPGGSYLGCNNGMGYFAARSDGICYAADGPH